MLGCYPAVDSISPPLMESTPEKSNATETWWQPEPGFTWQIQFVDEIDLAQPVDVYDLDLFESTAEQIDALHQRGVRVICYLNAGAWEDWRLDSIAFPDGVLGADYVGWSGERWLDIRQIEALAPIMTARLDLCVAKGFDGVDPDNLGGYANVTGFPLTADDQIAYNCWLADEAHQRGLGIGLKNDPEQAMALVNYFDWALTESCFKEGWCDAYNPFIEVAKPVFAIEYVEEGMMLVDFCPQADALSIDALLKYRNLDAWAARCP